MNVASKDLCAGLDKIKDRPEGISSPPVCLNCGEEMKPVYDEMAKKITGYLWRCDCMSQDVIVSIG